MDRIPLIGGPLDGETVHPSEVRDGRYTTARRIDAGDGREPHREQVTYLLRKGSTPVFTETYAQVVELRRRYLEAGEREREEMMEEAAVAEARVTELARVREWLEWAAP
ncbi:hypothetical protein [Nocardiopsis potens]|uniref:hypothetical protein n=1 Tax=Nocardiopsis potens TaxID=1246458 RepID=UPI000347E5C7|nr:hypothetical protein [Nocardiopsis potens]